MANMSYCRFYNTSNDVYDCLGAIDEIQDGSISKLSENEANAGESMFRAILDFCRDMEIIDEYDGGRLTELFNELYED